MSTDLTKVQDHPAVIIRAVAQDSDREAAAHQEDAALALLRHERLHSVTFAALDNDALAAVREAYTGLRTPDEDDLLDRVETLASAIRDLLGLDD